MNAQEIETAKQWFIARFVHSLPARNFVARRLAGERLQQRVIDRNARFYFDFITIENHLVVFPLRAEAHWCYGTIQSDDAGQLQYCSLNREAF